MKKRTLLFTDLDGTLLDHKTYSYNKAKKALNLIKKNKIPLIFCTSKTRIELEYYIKRFKNNDPFISENGAAIFIPKNYFNFKFKYNKKNKKYFIIEFGANVDKLKEVLNKIKKEIKIRSFIDMSAKEIASDAGLSIKSARLAKKREYDIPFKLIEKNKEKQLIRLIGKSKLNYTKGGRYCHIMGNSDKGKAVGTLINLYKKHFKKEIVSYAFGDSKNDFEMLEAVDNGFLVKKFNNKYASSRYKKANGIGPIGFNKEVLKILR